MHVTYVAFFVSYTCVSHACETHVSRMCHMRGIFAGVVQRKCMFLYMVKFLFPGLDFIFRFVRDTSTTFIIFRFRLSSVLLQLWLNRGNSLKYLYCICEFTIPVIRQHWKSRILQKIHNYSFGFTWKQICRHRIHHLPRLKQLSKPVEVRTKVQDIKKKYAT